MRRIGLAVVLAVSLALAPFSAEAQPAKRMATVVLVSDDFITGPLPPNYREAFVQGLRDLGWVEGTNFRLEQRAAKTVELRPATAAEIVKLKPDVIVAWDGAAFAYGPVAPEVAAAAGQRFWSPIRDIPIVFVMLSDPVATGLVQSLARPGGTMTGNSYLGLELNPKRLQLLKEALPGITRVAVLVPSNYPLRVRDRMVREVEAAAGSLGVKLQLLEVSSLDPPEKIDQAFAAMVRERAQAVLGLQGAHFWKERRRIAELSLTHRLPGAFEGAEYAEVGCLLAYMANPAGIFKHAARYVDQILKGARPADLPVEQPTKFELIINLKTAKALGPHDPAVGARAGRPDHRVGMLDQRGRLLRSAFVC
jgi:putative ABC transport system substrate-binding protein